MATWVRGRSLLSPVNLLISAVHIGARGLGVLEVNAETLKYILIYIYICIVYSVKYILIPVPKPPPPRLSFEKTLKLLVSRLRTRVFLQFAKFVNDPIHLLLSVPGSLCWVTFFSRTMSVQERVHVNEHAFIPLWLCVCVCVWVCFCVCVSLLIRKVCWHQLPLPGPFWIGQN